MSERTYNSPRDEVLHALALEGWANASAGRIDAPTGAFERISNSEQELPEVVDAFKKEIEDAGLADTAQLIGHYLIVETVEPPVQVYEFESEDRLKAAFAEHEEAFRAWERGNA